MHGFWKPEGIAPRTLAPGVTAKIASGEKLMFSLVTLAPDAVVPAHSHPHEQMGMMVSGSRGSGGAGCLLAPPGGVRVAGSRASAPRRPDGSPRQGTGTGGMAGFFAPFFPSFSSAATHRLIAER